VSGRAAPGADPPERAAGGRRRRHLRLVTDPPRVAGERPFRVADVALFYGERSGGIRTYLDAKAAHARATGGFEHHLLVPGRHERHVADGATWRHELPSLRVAAANGYRWPLGTGPLKATLRLVRPEVVLLHDPFWRPVEITETARALGAAVVMVHHGSAALDAGAWPGPRRLYEAAFRSWLRRAYAPADAIMAACDPLADTGRPAALELRFGLDPAFRPQPGVERADHVLYVGRLAREKGVLELLDAAALAEDPWPVHLVGAGTAEDAIAARVRQLGLAQRVSVRPFVTDRAELARLYAGARCVVMPGAVETFGLVAFEAAACGAATVACSTAPAATALGRLAHTFEPGDPAALLAAVERARASEPDRAAAERFAAANRWPAALTAELTDLERLAGRRPPSARLEAGHAAAASAPGRRRADEVTTAWRR
jgi:alpha-1,6-mannosyltransferase